MLATSTETEATFYINPVSGRNNLTQIKTRKEILSNAYKLRNESQSADVDFAEFCQGNRQQVKSNTTAQSS